MTAAQGQSEHAKRPQQARSRRRFEAVLQEVETLLLEQGIKGVSIPVLAERLGYTRPSIYAYFPSVNAIFNELQGQYLNNLLAWLAAHAELLADRDWRRAVDKGVHLTAEFHNDNPAARLLLLGGPVTDESYHTREATLQRLGELAGQLVPSRDLDLPPLAPEIPMLAADICTTCFRASFFSHGEITPGYADEAVRAIVAYLESYETDGRV